ncbi:MAG TPA: phosphatidylglycerol lysyltransferase domain-containing protein [Syntrophales bacterium]|nr:phosphatidylglycerol lysyltransferase domain-containing protein [Syntrophales bacterium]HRT27084.1 phosphatidylglycerol lysyltransferase domain-containing protein [Syntrophales bacterium]HRT70146.1 phosphatidylglycerol lysyltransferase domain-containing protein [Syntrophales bacterium]
MKIEKIGLSHRPIISRRFAALGTCISDFTFANVFLFRDVYNYSLVENDYTVIDYRMDNDRPCWMPLDDLRTIPREGLIRLLAKHGVLFPVPEEWLDAFQGPEFSLSYKAGEQDYLYRVEKMATFRGRRLNRKRNRLKQFLSLYRHEAGELTPDRLPDAIGILDAWQAETGLEEEETDYRPCLEALHLSEPLHLDGRVYYVEGEPAGFLVGESLNHSTYAIHFAKGIKSYKGLYEFMFNDAAKRLLNRYEFLNLEEDLGRESLRVAKSAYDPDLLVKKFRVSLK